MAASVLHLVYQIISQFYRTEIAIATPMKKTPKMEIGNNGRKRARCQSDLSAEIDGLQDFAFEREHFSLSCCGRNS